MLCSAVLRSALPLPRYVPPRHASPLLVKVEQGCSSPLLYISTPLLLIAFLRFSIAPLVGSLLRFAFAAYAIPLYAVPLHRNSIPRISLPLLFVAPLCRCNAAHHHSNHCLRNSWHLVALLCRCRASLCFASHRLCMSERIVAVRFRRTALPCPSIALLFVAIALPHYAGPLIAMPLQRVALSCPASP